MSEDSSISISLGGLVKIYRGKSLKDVDHFREHLLKAQVAAVSEFIFDRLKSTGSLEFAKAFIPGWYRKPDFKDEKKWSLDWNRQSSGSAMRFEFHLNWACLLRCPAPGKSPETFADYQWETGLAASLIFDLQRIYACLETSQEESTWDLGYMSAVAKESTSNFSPKVVMPMSTQAEWRQDKIYKGKLKVEKY